jgi:rRNA maturation RNase YbeY
VAVRFFSDEISFQPTDKQKLSRWLKNIATGEGKKPGDLHYIFVTDEKILDLNRRFLQHDYYTDILTFDNSSGNTVAGEMYISIHTVRANAESYQTGFDCELRRVMAHGVLHLCGYNDLTETEQSLMREAETRYLKQWTIDSGQ